MIEVLSTDNMRRSDQAAIANAGIDEYLMVTRAAQALFGAHRWAAPVAVVVGKGNNGSDGYALALLFRQNGIQCTVFSLFSEEGETCRRYHDECVAAGVDVLAYVPYHSFRPYATVVDCIFGVGFHGAPAGVVKSVIESINDSGAYVVSVDVNSGLDADNGLADTCVRSHLTLSVGGFKPGHFLNMAADNIGELRNVDIGVKPLSTPYYLVEHSDVAALFTPRKHFSNKGDFGYVALIGGSLPYSGAIRLAYMASAAMRSGAGVVKVAMPRSLCPLVVPHVLESTLFPLDEEEGSLAFNEAQIASLVANVRTLAFGMGAGVTPATQALLSYLLAYFTGTLIVDADGLNALARLPVEEIRARTCKLVLTPHVKEFARLTGTDVPSVLRDFIPLARTYAADLGCVLVLKGPTTVVTDGVTVCMVQAGAPGMATAGSGDVLSGILSATTAYIPALMPAVCAGVYINGKAGEAAQAGVGDVSMVASDTVAAIPAVIRHLVQD